MFGSQKVMRRLRLSFPKLEMVSPRQPQVGFWWGIDRSTIIILLRVLGVTDPRIILPNSIVSNGAGSRSPEVTITYALNIHTKYWFALADKG